MMGRYLVRFDDICPTMNWAVFDEIEKICDEFGVLPIIAVVPDNKDKMLIFQDAVSDGYFWARIRAVQAKGWTIALHGYQHIYESNSSGLTGINGFSEFAGLSYEIQSAKISKGLEIFRINSVRADCWIAPGHSFDQLTLRVLKEKGLHIVSDGFALFPFRKDGISWIPQQLWRFRRFPLGVWTVCFHHNNWKRGDLEKFRRDLSQYSVVKFNDLSFRNDIFSFFSNACLKLIWILLFKIRMR